MLRFYKYSVGANRDPSVAVGLYTDDAVWDNPVQFVSQAGLGFEHSQVHDLYLYNDADDVDFSNISVFTVDLDTSDGLNEYDWLEYRVLDESTGQWSIWSSNLAINSVLSAPKVLRYYKGDEIGFGNMRDYVRVQARVEIPTGVKSQLKDDVIMYANGDPTANNNGGRP